MNVVAHVQIRSKTVTSKFKLLNKKPPFLREVFEFTKRVGLIIFVFFL